MGAFLVIGIGIGALLVLLVCMRLLAMKFIFVMNWF